MDFDPLILSRIQFAFTISFHILFPAFTIGLASWLVVLEALWLKTHNDAYKKIYKFWVKIFAVTFGMGVVSGVVLSYQFGTNWSEFASRVGNILGPLLSFEVLAAFFLESSFLGIMLFGWDRVHRNVHFISTLVVAMGTLISAFWILSANSWMHTPAGFEIRAGKVFHPTSWFEIIFNPSFPYRFLHMVTAAYLTTAFVVSGVASWYLWFKKHLPLARIMFGMAMIMAIFVTPIQIFLGDSHGLNTLAYQPAKIAAIEAIWETETNAPLTLIGWPDQENQVTKYAIKVPQLGSIILTHSLKGEIKGLKEWAKADQPPVAPVFFAFRVMVGIGVLMLATGVTGFILYLRKRLFDTSWFQGWCMLMTPSGFVAVLAGWIVTEMGRQPYTVYHLLRTSESVSPVYGTNIMLSLIAFIVIYLFVFGAGSYYIIKLILRGPEEVIEKTKGEIGTRFPILFGDHPDKTPGEHEHTGDHSA